jgi:membrane protein YqaA with SNARE-associated domain
VNKATMGGVGGAAAGYVLMKKSPILGAVVGYFAGRFLGGKLDNPAVAAQEAENAAIEAAQAANTTGAGD